MFNLGEGNLRAPRFCSYEFCPTYSVHLVRGENRYHREPCKALAKRAADRERFCRRYHDGKIGRCLHCRQNRKLVWTVGQNAWPAGFDSYLYREALLCSEKCFVAFHDARPDLVKPAAYYLITGIPEEERPALKPGGETLIGDEALMDWLLRGQLKGAGHKHSHGKQCENCMTD
jgi:hypothetical protein